MIEGRPTYPKRGSILTERYKNAATFNNNVALLLVVPF